MPKAAAAAAAAPPHRLMLSASGNVPVLASGLAGCLGRF
jgi:hypothetical protein